MAIRDLLFDEGVQILSRDGLAGLTIGRLATAANCSKSGVVAHFKSKQQLQIELLGASAALSREYVISPSLLQAPGLPRLADLISRWLGWSGRAGLSGGCPIAAALFEVDDVDGPVREHVVRLDQAWRNVLGALIKEAIAEGHFQRDIDSEQVAWELCGIYLSHHASSRFLRDASANERAQLAVSALFSRVARATISRPTTKGTA